MKLVKMVYISHGWYMALFDRELINEPAIAWKYGPVIESVYNGFKKFGKSQITSYSPVVKVDKELTTEDKLFLNRIWEVYSPFDGLQLSTMTHQPNTPWDKTERFNIIPNQLIKSHFKEKSQKPRGQETS